MSSTEARISAPDEITCGNLWFAHLLRCPACACPLTSRDGSFKCTRGHSYPVVDGIPILIDNARSLFDKEQFERREETFFHDTASPFWRFAKKLSIDVMPNILENLKAHANYAHLSEILAKQRNPVVLVVGGGTVGMGMQDFIADPHLHFIESDIAFAPRTRVILDAHDIPLQSGSVDAVIAQGVLEHVLDPYRVVEEIVRVLKPDGVVYAETPFMQAGHCAPYDFHRFTAIGHRRLFRSFETISEGMCMGPAASFLWNFKAFLIAVTPTRRGKTFAGLFAQLFFFFRYFDRFLIEKRSAWDAASMFYFLGRKTETVISDRDLIKMYAP